MGNSDSHYEISLYELALGTYVRAVTVCNAVSINIMLQESICN
jgi:hypothetical protein